VGVVTALLTRRRLETFVAVAFCVGTWFIVAPHLGRVGLWSAIAIVSFAVLPGTLLLVLIALPLYTARHGWKNRCAAKLELPLFPNYLFVRIDRYERVRVLEVPGVLSLVGFRRTPAPLPDFEIDALRSSVGKGTIEPHPFLVIGERVRIKRGPMAGMEGVLLRKKNNFRVVLALDVIMKCIAVEVAADDLEAAVVQASRMSLSNEFAGRPGLHASGYISR